MSSSALYNLTTVAYLVAMIAFFVVLSGRSSRSGSFAIAAAWSGFLLHTAATGCRWLESYRLGYGHAPLSNLYESVLFFAWSVVLMFLLADLRYRFRVIGAFVMPFALFAMAGAQLMAEGRKAIEPLLPALQSNWLLYHVLTCFLGYAAFAVACGVSIMYLLQEHQEHRTPSGKPGGIFALFPAASVLDELNYRAIVVGFPLLTLGIITGAAWANYAWGSYWSWDPKETWSLIVWLIYAAFLHARLTRGWVGRRAAILSIVGFAATLFCYLGVNLLLPGLHSYGSG